MRLSLAIGLLLVAAACAAAAEGVVPVANAGFEDVDAGGKMAGWSYDAAVYSSDATVAHSGSRCLRYRNEDPAVYTHCAQVLPLKAGQMYEFSAWVKTKGVLGEESGATICLEWSDAAGKYLGGCYPAGVKGDTDWTLVRAISGRVPADAASCHILCYVRPKMTGTAWFDDVQVKRAFAEPLQAIILTRPNYRGWLWPGRARTVEVIATVDRADLECSWADLALALEVLDATGKVVAVRNREPSGAETRLRLTLPAGLRPGRYTVRVSLDDRRSSKPLGAKAEPIVLLDRAPQARVYIDDHNRLIADGKPFLPLGCYWGAGDMKDDLLATFADSAFSCLMPYGNPTREQMDLARKHGLRVLYSIKDSYFGAACVADIKSEAGERPWTDGVMRRFRDHPALLGWYLNDELGLEYLDRLTAHQEWAHELDPNHPTWVVLYQYGQIREYAPSFDAVGTDPYPIPEHPRRASEWARATVEGVARSRPVWMVPQIMSWKCYDPKGSGRTPTLEEMRSMAWQCLCEGANGLVFYSFFDIRRDPDTPFDVQWPRVKQVAAEVARWAPVLLSVERPEPGSAAGDCLHVRKAAQGGKTYLFVVNDDYGPHEARFRIAAGRVVRRVSDGAEMKPDGPGQASDTIKGLDMQVYEVARGGS